MAKHVSHFGIPAIQVFCRLQSTNAFCSSTVHFTLDSTFFIMFRLPQANLEDSSTTVIGQKSRKRDRLKSLLKRKEPAQQTPSSQTSDLLVQDPITTDATAGDRQRTRTKYLDAVQRLEETVKAYEGQWGSFDFPELKGEPENFDDSLFREKINAVIEARKNDVNDHTAWAKYRYAVQCAFTAFSPFAKHFLSIAKDAQQVFVVPAFSHS
jgi:hypothetical protein